MDKEYQWHVALRPDNTDSDEPEYLVEKMNPDGSREHKKVWPPTRQYAGRVAEMLNHPDE